MTGRIGPSLLFEGFVKRAAPRVVPLPGEADGDMVIVPGHRIVTDHEPGCPEATGGGPSARITTRVHLADHTERRRRRVVSGSAERELALGVPPRFGAEPPRDPHVPREHLTGVVATERRVGELVVGRVGVRNDN